MNKRGLSGVVTTVILITLILTVIAVVWVVIDRTIISESTSEISLRKLTVDLDLESAQIDFDTGLATIRVKRNVGKGNLTGIKILAKDDKTTEVFDQRFELFEELAEKTIEINLTQPGSDLILSKTNAISIAPIIILESGKEVIGRVEQGIKGLNSGINQTEEEEEINEPGSECTAENIATTCGEDYWIEDTETCNEDNSAVTQYKKTFSCVLGFCLDDSNPLVKEDCATGTVCYEGSCIEEVITCASALECGTDGVIGTTRCQGESTIIQDSRTYDCTAGVCGTTDSTQTIQECPIGEICAVLSGQANCFIPVECSSDIDCPTGEICMEGECVTETSLNTGSIDSIWPFTLGEFFDSPNLPKEGEENTYNGKYIIFPGSTETRCLKITAHVFPNSTLDNAYVKLNESITSIITGDNYEIWKTNYICTTL